MSCMPSTFAVIAVNAVNECRWDASGVIVDVFSGFSHLTQQLSTSAGALVPGLYLVAVGMKFLDHMVNANAKADVRRTQTLHRCNFGQHCYCCWQSAVPAVKPIPARHCCCYMRVLTMLTDGRMAGS